MLHWGVNLYVLIQSISFNTFRRICILFAKHCGKAGRGRVLIKSELEGLSRYKERPSEKSDWICVVHGVGVCIFHPSWWDELSFGFGPRLFSGYRCLQVHFTFFFLSVTLRDWDDKHWWGLVNENKHTNYKNSFYFYSDFTAHPC